MSGQNHLNPKLAAILVAITTVIWPLAARAEYVIFDDAPAEGWTATGLGPRWNLDATVIVHAGKKSALLTAAKVTGKDKERCGFKTETPISTSGYDRLEVWMHGGKAGTYGKRVIIKVNDWDEGNFGRIERACTPRNGQWLLMSFPLRYFGYPSAIDQVSFGFAMGTCGSEGREDAAIYIDQVRLVSGPPSAEVYHLQTEWNGQYPEMIVDGGFEEGNRGSFVMACLGEVVTSPVYEGKHAYRIWNRTQPWAGPKWDYTPTWSQFGPGVYEFTAYCKLPANSPIQDPSKAKFHISCEATGKNIDPPFVENGKHISATTTQMENGWTKVQVKRQIICARSPNAMKFSVGADASIPEHYVDNVSVRRIEDIPEFTKLPKPGTRLVVKGQLLADVNKVYTITTLGKEGKNAGEFRYPFGICCGANGELFVTDTDNHRIQKLDKAGQWTAFGASGVQEGELLYPRGITQDAAGNLYVSDSLQERIQRIDPSGAWKVIETSAPRSEFKAYHDDNNHKPMSQFTLFADAQGGLLTVDYCKHRVWRRDNAGQWKFLSGESLGSGRKSMSLGTGPGMFEFPFGICADKSGNIYVADTGNHRIQKRAVDGSWQVLAGLDPRTQKVNIGELEGMGDKPGEFNNPRGIAADAAGNLYVADTDNHRIQKYDVAADTWIALGKKGSGPGEFHSPSGIAVRPDGGTVYVVDTGNHRIQILEKK